MSAVGWACVNTSRLLFRYYHPLPLNRGEEYRTSDSRAGEKHLARTSRSRIYVSKSVSVYLIVRLVSRNNADAAFSRCFPPTIAVERFIAPVQVLVSVRVRSKRARRREREGKEEERGKHFAS